MPREPEAVPGTGAGGPQLASREEGAPCGRGMSWNPGGKCGLRWRKRRSSGKWRPRGCEEQTVDRADWARPAGSRRLTNPLTSVKVL